MKSLKHMLKESLQIDICDEAKVPIYESLHIGICDEAKISACESLRIGINDNPYTESPTTPEELRQIIKKRFKELGPGTEKEPIDFNDVDVSNLTSFATNDNLNLFEATGFEYIDVSRWDISKIDNLSSAFAYCSCLKALDISNWDISNVQQSQYMFYRCGDLEKLLLPDFSKIKNINMIDMFDKCNPKSIPNWYIA